LHLQLYGSGHHSNSLIYLHFTLLSQETTLLRRLFFAGYWSLHS